MRFQRKHRAAWQPPGPTPSRAEAATIAANSTLVEIPPGTEICQQGGSAREVFVIVDGEVEVRRSGDLLATLGPGDLVGEMGVQTGAGRAASVTASKHLTAAVMSVQEFLRIRRDVPAFSAWVDEAVSRRDPSKN